MCNHLIFKVIGVLFIIIITALIYLFPMQHYNDDFIVCDNEYKIADIDMSYIRDDSPIMHDYFTGIEEKIIIDDIVAKNIANAVVYTNECSDIEYHTYIKSVKNDVFENLNNVNKIIEVVIRSKPCCNGKMNTLLGDSEYKVSINLENAEIIQYKKGDKDRNFNINEECAVRIATALFKGALKENSLSHSILKHSKKYIKNRYISDTQAILSHMVFVDDNDREIDVYEVQRKLKYINPADFDELIKLTYKYEEFKTLICVSNGKCLKIWHNLV